MAGGRPTLFKPEYIIQVKKLAARGMTDVEIADILNVTDRTFYRWKAEYPKFALALKLGKAEPNERVKQSLFRRACGYEYKTEKVFQHNGTIVRATTTEHVMPDTTAAIFFLKNRLPEEFRDKQQFEHSGTLSLAELVAESQK